MIGRMMMSLSSAPLIRGWRWLRLVVCSRWGMLVGDEDTFACYPCASYIQFLSPHLPFLLCLFVAIWSWGFYILSVPGGFCYTDWFFFLFSLSFLLAGGRGVNVVTSR